MNIGTFSACLDYLLKSCFILLYVGSLRVLQVRIYHSFILTGQLRETDRKWDVERGDEVPLTGEL